MESATHTACSLTVSGPAGPTLVERSTEGASPDIDAQILDAARLGDAASIERFVRHYERSVFAFLSRSLGRGPHIDDLAQEVFLRVLRALPQFEKREAKVSTWIFQIAVRLIQDQRKKPKRNFVLVNEEICDARPDPEQSCARRRLLTRIEILVEELPPEQRMALVLFEFHGMSHAEVGQVMNVGVPTVKTRLHRARTFLRQAMTEGKEG